MAGTARCGKTDWTRACGDASTIQAKRGAYMGPNPVDRGCPGSKHPLITGRNGIPLAVRLSAANVHDSNLLESLLDAVPSLKNRHGKLTYRPKKLHAGKGYDFPKCRTACTGRLSSPMLARTRVRTPTRITALSSHSFAHCKIVSKIAPFRATTPLGDLQRKQAGTPHHLVFSISSTFRCKCGCMSGYVRLSGRSSNRAIRSISRAGSGPISRTWA